MKYLQDFLDLLKIYFIRGEEFKSDKIYCIRKIEVIVFIKKFSNTVFYVEKCEQNFFYLFIKSLVSCVFLTNKFCHNHMVNPII